MTSRVTHLVHAAISRRQALDAGVLRLTTREHAVLFERVAPGVPVVVTVAAEAPLETRVALELAGFRVVTRPVTVEDLLAKAAL